MAPTKKKKKKRNVFDQKSQLLKMVMLHNLKGTTRRPITFETRVVKNHEISRISPCVNTAACMSNHEFGCANDTRIKRSAN